MSLSPCSRDDVVDRALNVSHFITVSGTGPTPPRAAHRWSQRKGGRTRVQEPIWLRSVVKEDTGSNMECMCSRILWSSNPIAKIAARTMDWAQSDEPQLWVLPRGLERTGGGDDAISWTSKYGSVAVSGYDLATTDALNEVGLGVHLLYLENTVYEPVDRRQTVLNTLLAQWLVDTCSTVAEAVAQIADVRVASADVRGESLGVHFALEDPSGDSAIIEFIDGRKVIHHSPSTLVMTNDPAYDDQIQNLERYAGFGGDLALPGDILPTDRFVRASYFLSHLPEPATYQQTVAGIIGIARNVAVPPGAPDGAFGVYPTWWISASDLTIPTFYFQPVTSPNLFWVDLATLNLEIGSPVLSLDPAVDGLLGNVAGSFTSSSLIY